MHDKFIRPLEGKAIILAHSALVPELPQTARQLSNLKHYTLILVVQSIIGVTLKAKRLPVWCIWTTNAREIAFLAITIGINPETLLANEAFLEGGCNIHKFALVLNLITSEKDE